jgi:hypothetical protein
MIADKFRSETISWSYARERGSQSGASTGPRNWDSGLKVQRFEPKRDAGSFAQRSGRIRLDGSNARGAAVRGHSRSVRARGSAFLHDPN